MHENFETVIKGGIGLAKWYMNIARSCQESVGVWEELDYPARVEKGGILASGRVSFCPPFTGELIVDCADY